ncbi:hypothetical protein SAMN04489858_103248 [Paracoccus homiensis]|uniref:Uncharacterized protein n=2 Tax=Paracoccus homiensis TaxID=364199 RepID=A0A1I0CBB3_9RHOB|nr:hypothetical protein SAMN04489858_103248 [Paracoccus homiensis]
MNDMEMSGFGNPEGPFATGPKGGDARTDSVNAAASGVNPEEALAVAEGHFWSCIRDLKRHEAALQARESGGVDAGEIKEALHSAKAVRDAIGLMMAERNRVDKLRKDIAGGVGGGCLDLDEARDEIGRRLACLRRAAGS